MKPKQSSNKKVFAPYNNLFSNLGELTNSSMDWSVNTSVMSSPLLCIPPAKQYMPSPHTSLPKNGSNMSGQSNPDTIVILLNYSNNQPTDPVT